ncbi:hypothetical protein R3W88_002208 [Solanum pinnatisectum]|uniref:FBD domain-containing protein n=1 Tax=Solanum pinnatisectum TaxID=50273 RepID=A0AAV9ML41_9SOLN|nr:hypothetical protein R3W88_002208 [Solanum pinnatisectum]
MPRGKRKVPISSSPNIFHSGSCLTFSPYDGLSRNKIWQMHDLDESILCLESHLKSIRLIDFKGEENEIKLLKFFLKNARVLEKLTIFWVKYPDKSEEALEKVLKLPRTFSQVVLTFLDAKPQPSSHKWYDR